MAPFLLEPHPDGAPPVRSPQSLQDFFLPMAGNSTRKALAQPKPSGRCVLSSQEQGEHHFPASQNLLAVKNPASRVISAEPRGGPGHKTATGSQGGAAGTPKGGSSPPFRQPAGPCSRLGPSCRCGEDEQGGPCPQGTDSPEETHPRVSPRLVTGTVVTKGKHRGAQGQRVSSSWVLGRAQGRPLGLGGSSRAEVGWRRCQGTQDWNRTWGLHGPHLT